MSSIFERIGRITVRRRGWVLAAWLVVVVAGGAAARDLPSRLQSGGFAVPGSESARAADVLQRAFPNGSASTLVIVMTSAGPRLGTPEHQEAVSRIAAAVAGGPDVERVATAYDAPRARLASGDGRVALASVTLRTADEDRARDAVPAVRERVASAAPPDWLAVHVTGGPAVDHDMTRAAADDLPQAERVGLPVALATLLAAFGALVAAGIPLLVGLIAIALTMGIAAVLASQVPLSTFIQNIVPMLGLGVGIDYCLFMVSRFREELAAGRTPEDAAIRTAGTAGRAVAFSGLTVAIGLAALFVPDLMVLRSVALGGILVTAVAVLAAVTLLPALLATLGPRIDAPAALSARLRSRPGSRLWHGWALAVMRRPALFALAALVALGFLGSQAARISTLAPGAAMLPEGTSSRAGSEALAAAFGPGEMSPITVVVDTGRDDGARGVDSLAALSELMRSLEDDERFARVDGPLVDAAGRVAWLRAIPSIDPDSLAGRDLVRDLREAARNHTGLGEVLVGGATASSLDLQDELFRSFPLVVGLVLALSFVVLTVVLRSIPVAIIGVLMNAMSVLAAYGVLVLVFQDGAGAEALGFTPIGAVTPIIPVVLFAILFGLSMDYQIFLLSRVREAFDASGDARRAVALGLEGTGRIITSAALIMVAVFGSFALSRFVLMKEMGVGMSAAVFLDATLIRVLLAPAVLGMLGAAAWWLPGSPAGARRRSRRPA